MSTSSASSNTIPPDRVLRSLHPHLHPQPSTASTTSTRPPSPYASTAHTDSLPASPWRTPTTTTFPAGVTGTLPIPNTPLVLPPTPTTPIPPNNSAEEVASNMPTLDSEHTRLIIVSNRLPITITAHSPETDLHPGTSSSANSNVTAGGQNAQYTFKMSSGGLVSALSGCKKQMSFSWIGWSGLDVAASDKEIVQQRLAEEYSCKAVWLDDELADRHYNGFSNSILWPLFHYHPGEMNFDEDNWEAYKEANMRFAESVHDDVKDSIIKGEDCLVWVQDYHLMLLPMLLRQLVDQTTSTATLTEGVKKPGRISIGFFLHTPFPSSEIYRILPVRREILLGPLHCDLIGFHTYDYARHFLSSCTRILGLPAMPNGLEYKGRYVHVGSFPIGIDPTQFLDNLKTDAVKKRIEALKSRFEGIKVIVGVDRLDYIKGIPQKLHAYDVFLSEHPEWIGKVVLVQVAVPSRQDVEEYQNLRASVNELVGRINGRFGTVEHAPIHFMHQSVTFDELCALYAVSDACLVTSTRDGMNLVSYEYIACQQLRHGSMILSEFTGAAHSLNGALIVNPWSTDQVADAIHKAVNMSARKRADNFDKTFAYVSKYTAAHWGLTFVKELLKIVKLEEEANQASTPVEPKK